jgi:endonuclease/exonuclease/phosphatase family metal-dependent hydrolase
VQRIILFAAHTWSALAVVAATAAVASAQPAAITAMTFNTKHGGQAPWNTTDQIAEIVAENPDIVMLQEANSSQLEEYVDGINRGLHSTAWHGEFAYHCDAGHAPDCTRRTDEAVMVLTRLPIVDAEPRLIWSGDEYFVARGVLRVEVRVDARTTAQVFACHLPASEAAGASRIQWVNDFLPWARAFGGARLVGGDFNDDPSSAPVGAMKREYVDAWGTKGTGAGGTHSHDDAHYGTRIDYLFSAGGLRVQSAYTPQVRLSDHRPVVARYSTNSKAESPAPSPVPTVPAVQPAVPSTPTGAGSPAAAPAAAPTTVAGETVLLDDNFDSGAIDPAKWPTAVFSGYQDMRVAVTPAHGGVEIAALAGVDGISRYNGLTSAPVNLKAGGYGRVQLVQGPVGSAAYAMFTAASDPMNFYRIYQGGASDARALLIEKRISGTKLLLTTAPYSVADDQYLTIRHDVRPNDGVDDVVFEASPASATGGSIELFREPWDPSVLSSTLQFELKAGTSAPEAQPGTVVFDNFHAAAVSGR